MTFLEFASIVCRTYVCLKTKTLYIVHSFKNRTTVKFTFCGQVYLLGLPLILEGHVTKIV